MKSLIAFINVLRWCGSSRTAKTRSLSITNSRESVRTPFNYTGVTWIAMRLALTSIAIHSLVKKGGKVNERITFKQSAVSLESEECFARVSRD